jgi:uncharacterized membrane protein
MRLALHRTGFALLALLSLAICGYAAYKYGFRPLGENMHPAMRKSFESHRWAIYLHVAASIAALAIGPFQFVRRLRSRLPGLHRLLGRIYLGGGVLLGGLAGLYMALHAFGGWPTRLGFALLALAWLYTGMRAYRAIRSGDPLAHRRWMIRNFALTFAAVTLRLLLPTALVSGLRFADAYPYIAWLCWVPNLLVAELFLAMNTHSKAGLNATVVPT